MDKPTECRSCRAPLVQPASGRPRLVCPDAGCQRRAEADRKRLLRRRKAGLADVDLEPLARYSGGRRPLVRRMAWRLAADRFRNATPTEWELVALEAAVRAGAGRIGGYTGDLGPLMRGQPHWRTQRSLSAEDRRVLNQLDRRNRTGTPPPATQPTPRKASPAKPRAQYGSGLPGDPSVIGQLPEPFFRSGRARGAGSRGRSHGWIVLPDPEEDKPLIDLPLPDERYGRP